MSVELNTESDARHRPLLAIKDIQKSFPGVQVLKGVSLNVYPGEVHALVGENGAGKSTLMHILAGVYQPNNGSITFDGQLNKEIKYVRKSLTPHRVEDHR